MSEIDLSGLGKPDKVLALYDGRCPDCQEPIKADIDYIVRNEDGEWVHYECDSE